MVSNNFMEIQIGGGGSLNLEILRGGGTQAVLEIQVDGGGVQKTMPSVMGVWIFSGITPCCIRSL